MELKNFFVLDDQGNKLPGAQCYLYRRGTESPAPGAVKANGAPLSIPFTADNDGLVQLAAPNGLYDLRVTSIGRDYRIKIQFNDVSELNESAQDAAQRAEVARDAAQLSAGVYADTAAGLADAASGGYFNVPSAESSEYLILYKNNAGVAVEIKRYPSVGAVDGVSERLESRMRTLSSSQYPIIEVDTGSGRMSRFVDTAGHTFLKLRADVELPGDQVTDLPISALEASAISRLLPIGNQFISTDKYPLVLIDITNRMSELIIDKSGRFPRWVAKAIVARAGTVNSGFGGATLSEAYLDATQLADGALLPMDTSQSSVSYGIAPLYASGGLIVHDAIRADNNAGYLEVALRKAASRVGAAYSFPVGAGGAITLVLPSSSWVSSPGGTPAGIHFVLNYNGSWNCSYLNLGESFYASGNVGNQADGVMRFVDVSVNGNDVSIHLPDGATVKFTDARVGANITNLVIWELYEFAAQAVRPHFHALWADSKSAHASLRDTRTMAEKVVAFINSEASA